MYDLYLIILRLLHITSGVFWAGAAIYLAAFVLPAAKALGADGNKYMQQLTMTNKMPVVLLVAGTINILSGILLLWKLTNGFTANMSSSVVSTFMLGGVAGIAAYIIGLTVNRPAAMQMASIAKNIQGGIPNAGQIQQIEMLKKKLGKGVNIIAWILSISVICMSIARYM